MNHKDKAVEPSTAFFVKVKAAGRSANMVSK
ncbi:hypothetical protein A943_01765 [Bacillus sp. CPSM8]|nr:hypothetical protein A943_01765 [Bacillus sp. CPSM8]